MAPDKMLITNSVHTIGRFSTALFSHNAHSNRRQTKNRHELVEQVTYAIALASSNKQTDCCEQTSAPYCAVDIHLERLRTGVKTIIKVYSDQIIQIAIFLEAAFNTLRLVSHHLSFAQQFRCNLGSSLTPPTVRKVDRVR